MIERAPAAATIYGVSGLLPFAALAAAMWVAPHGLSALAGGALLTYGAGILAFLGGVRWGAAMPDGEPVALTLAMWPPLLGWGGVLFGLMGRLELGLAVVALGLVSLLFSDLRYPRFPAWYKRLRIGLTIGAATATLVGLAAVTLRSGAGA